MATWSDTSGLNYQSLQDAGAPSGPDLIMNFSQGSEKGVGLLYQDEYNQAAQNAYNNAYNYWLWQKQMEYNSPKAQVERLKEAGLNPNFNSIDGTGNASSIPASQGSTRGNIASNHLQAIGSAVSLATGLAKSIAQGVHAAKEISGIPKGEYGGIAAYRRLLFAISNNKLQGGVLDNALKSMEEYAKRQYYGIGAQGEDFYDLFGRGFGVNMDAPGWIKMRGDAEYSQARAAYQGILNGMATYKADTIQPQELANMKAQWNFITKGTELRQLEINWKNPKEAMGIIRTLLPLVGMMLFHK